MFCMPNTQKTFVGKKVGRFKSLSNMNKAPGFIPSRKKRMCVCGGGYRKKSDRYRISSKTDVCQNAKQMYILRFVLGNSPSHPLC